MLTEDQSNDLERVQKAAVKTVLQKSKKSENYQKCLDFLQLDTLKNRRQKLCLQFAQKCQKNIKSKVQKIVRKNRQKIVQKSSKKTCKTSSKNRPKIVQKFE